MSEFTIRPMRADEWDQVSQLVRDSANHWYESHARGEIFTGPPESTRLFCEVYEAIDPGFCIVAEDPETGKLAGSCFYRRPETHISLGMMNRTITRAPRRSSWFRPRPPDSLERSAAGAPATANCTWPRSAETTARQQALSCPLSCRKQDRLTR